MSIAPTGQCTGVGVKEVGDDASWWNTWIRGNRCIEGNNRASTKCIHLLVLSSECLIIFVGFFFLFVSKVGLYM